MVTVTAETWVSSSLKAIWTALGRRSTYFYFPGITAGARTGPLAHVLDLPIVERQEQASTLTVSRSDKDRHRERRFGLRGPLVRIAGRWELTPGEDAVRVRLTLDYDIAPALKTLAVNTLRSRSPLPIRTDADAIMSRAVDEFFETRFTEHAAVYCAALRERLDGRPA
ncbi:MAG TPA: hypothetical protein VFE48_06025 [Methylomirabilota bacterium]|nr:hypothetical protein [Methylomirabilota bacterium]